MRRIGQLSVVLLLVSAAGCSSGSPSGTPGAPSGTSQSSSAAPNVTQASADGDSSATSFAQFIAAAAENSDGDPPSAVYLYECPLVGRDEILDFTNRVPELSMEGYNVGAEFVDGNRRAYSPPQVASPKVICMWQLEGSVDDVSELTIGVADSSESTDNLPAWYGSLGEPDSGISYTLLTSTTVGGITAGCLDDEYGTVCIAVTSIGDLDVYVQFISGSGAVSEAGPVALLQLIAQPIVVSLASISDVSTFTTEQ